MIYFKMNRTEKIREIIYEMFLQRDYTDIDTSNNERIIAKKPNGDNICAFTNIIARLNVSEIHIHISILQKENITHGIIIFDGIPTPAVKNVIGNTPNLDLNIELFDACDLQFNITKHILVPTHVRLNKEEIKDFKQKYGTDIPVILRTDPISRFYDFSKGEIIKIIRRNGFISYRIVR